MAGEREERQGHRDTDIDADHAAIGPPSEFPGFVAVAGKDGRTVGELVSVHDGNTFFEVLDPLDADHGSEDFLIADNHSLV